MGVSVGPAERETPELLRRNMPSIGMRVSQTETDAFACTVDER